MCQPEAISVLKGLECPVPMRQAISLNESPSPDTLGPRLAVNQERLEFVDVPLNETVRVVERC